MLAPFGALAEFDHASYKSAELSDVSAWIEIDPRVDYWLDASHPRYRTIAVFTGRSRPIDPGVKGYIDIWAKAMGHPPSLAEMFSSEVEVRQGVKTYWMPIQESLVSPWEEEMVEDSEAELYILLMGAYKHVPAFAISSFSAKI